MTPRRSPIRMCMVCRGRDDKQDLLRFSYNEGEFCRDRDQRGGGRGVYFHIQCLATLQGLKLKRLEYALRLDPGSLDYGSVISALTEGAEVYSARR
jgi:predicted RNA-binding protein YlxR (DUF448 family)